MAAKRPRPASPAAATRKATPTVPTWLKWASVTLAVPLAIGVATNLLSVPFQKLVMPEPAPPAAAVPVSPEEELRRVVIVAANEVCADLLGSLDALAADTGFVAKYRKMREYSPDKGFALISSIASLPLGSELRNRAEQCQNHAAYALSRTSYNNPVFP